jgi:hypothetical protein
MAQFAPGELFAPAWIKGNPQAEQAVNDWQQKYFAVNNDTVNASRAPATFGTGNAAGAVDYNALIAMAQGGLYDPAARRNAIAAQVQANQAAAPQQPVPQSQAMVPQQQAQQQAAAPYVAPNGAIGAPPLAYTYYGNTYLPPEYRDAGAGGA